MLRAQIPSLCPEGRWSRGRALLPSLRDPSVLGLQDSPWKSHRGGHSWDEDVMAGHGHPGDTEKGTLVTSSTGSWWEALPTAEGYSCLSCSPAAPQLSIAAPQSPPWAPSSIPRAGSQHSPAEHAASQISAKRWRNLRGSSQPSCREPCSSVGVAGAQRNQEKLRLPVEKPGTK